MNSNDRIAAGRAPGAVWVRIALGDLMAWVVAAGIAAAVCRESRVFEWTRSAIDEARIFGLAAAFLAIVMGMALYRQVAARIRTRGERAVVASLVGTGWRLAMMGGLGVLVAAEAQALAVGDWGSFWWEAEGVRSRLLPITLTLVMAGLIAALSPLATRAPAPRRAWLSVVWAAIAGIVIVATQAVIAYLTLLALEVVRNAMSGPAVARVMSPVLPVRIARAGLEAAPVLACCLTLGLLLSRELRRSDFADRSRVLLLALVVTAIGAAAGAGRLVAVTVPDLDTMMSEGVRGAVDPWNALIIVVGFAGLALGVASRSCDLPGQPPADPGETRRRVSLGKAVGGAFLALLIVDFVAARAIDLIIMRRAVQEGPIDPGWERWIGWVDAAFNELRSILPTLGSRGYLLFDGPEWLALMFAEAWIAWRLFALLSAPVSDGPVPIDAWLDDRRGLGRLLLRWGALTVMMVAALPALFLGGLAVLSVLIGPGR